MTATDHPVRGTSGISRTVENTNADAIPNGAEIGAAFTVPRRSTAAKTTRHTLRQIVQLRSRDASGLARMIDFARDSNMWRHGMHRRSTAEANPIAARVIAYLIGKHPQIQNSILIYGPKLDLPSYITTANNFKMKCHVSTKCSTLLGKLTSRNHIILALLLVKEIPKDVAIVLAEACEWINPFYILQIHKRTSLISQGDEQYEVFIHSAAPVSDSDAAERVSIATKQLFHPANSLFSIEPSASRH